MRLTSIHRKQDFNIICHKAQPIDKDQLTMSCQLLLCSFHKLMGSTGIALYGLMFQYTSSVNCRSFLKHS